MNNSIESQSCDVWGSRVTSEGVLLEDYIGKYNLCHSNCHFLLHFLKQALREQQFWCGNCKKTPNIDGKNKYLGFVSYHLARAENGRRDTTQHNGCRLLLLCTSVGLIYSNRKSNICFVDIDPWCKCIVNFSVYARQTQQSAQSFRPCLSGEFDIWHPWSETRKSLSMHTISIVVGCIIFNNFVEQLCYPQYILLTHTILQTITQGHCQHDEEKVCGVTVVVGASTWTLSSWFRPPDAWGSTVDGGLVLGYTDGK
jgi:hypothetical protein